MMEGRLKIKLIKVLILLFVILLTVSCASTKHRNPWVKKRKGTYVDARRIGVNKLFYTPKYQKKLKKSYYRRKR